MVYIGRIIVFAELAKFQSRRFAIPVPSLSWPTSNLSVQIRLYPELFLHSRFPSSAPRWRQFLSPMLRQSWWPAAFAAWACLYLCLMPFMVTGLLLDLAVEDHFTFQYCIFLWFHQSNFWFNCMADKFSVDPGSKGDSIPWFLAILHEWHCSSHQTEYLPLPLLECYKEVCRHADICISSVPNRFLPAESGIVATPQFIVPVVLTDFLQSTFQWKQNFKHLYIPWSNSFWFMGLYLPPHIQLVWPGNGFDFKNNHWWVHGIWQDIGAFLWQGPI